MKMRMIALLITVKSMCRRRRIREGSKSDCKNKNNNRLLTLIGALSINLTYWWKILSPGSQSKKATKTQCKSSAKPPYANSMLTPPSEIGSSNLYIPRSNCPANHATMSILPQEYVPIVERSWTVLRSFNILCGKWCSKKEGIFIVMVAKGSREGIWRSVLVVVSGPTESILWTGYLIPPESSLNGTLLIKSLNSWELTNFILLKNDPQIS